MPIFPQKAIVPPNGFGSVQVDEEIEIDGKIYKFTVEGANDANNLLQSLSVDPTLYDMMTSPRSEGVSMTLRGKNTLVEPLLIFNFFGIKSEPLVS